MCRLPTQRCARDCAAACPMARRSPPAACGSPACWRCDDGGPGGSTMNSKRIVFLLLAMIVAGTTAFLARAWLQSERAAFAAQMGGPQPVTAKPAVQVLVTRNVLRTGQIIKPEDLRWQAWPAGSLPPTYI